MLKLAVVGCGNITHRTHLPLAQESQRVEVVGLADSVLSRAQTLAEAHAVPRATDDYRELIGDADAAIVALPNYLHAPVTADLLSHGIHVLVEKPMALSAAECDEMIEAAGLSGAVLGVGLVRRFYEASRFVKQVVAGGVLGRAVRFDVREGGVFRWGVKSDFMFRKDAAGGGVLADVGVHVLDLLIWWFGDCGSLEYRDDAEGGVEADCEIHLAFGDGVEGTVELSRIREMPNSARIEFERGVLEFEAGAGFDPPMRLEIPGSDLALSGKVVGPETGTLNVRDAFRRQLDDFIDAVLESRDPMIPGPEGKRSVELSERCYAIRQPLTYPWALSVADG